MGFRWGVSKIPMEKNGRNHRDGAWPRLLAFTMSMAVSAVFFNNCSNEFTPKTGEVLLSSDGDNNNNNNNNGNGGGNNQLTACGELRMKAFTDVLHPFTRQKCVLCHVPGGPPAFAAPDALTAFAVYESIGIAKLKTRGLDSHGSGATGPQNQASLDAAAAAFAAVEESPSCKTGGGGDATPTPTPVPGDAATLAAKAINAPVDNSVPPALPVGRVITWALDTEVTGRAGFGAATFEITVYQKTPVGAKPTYYFSKPVLKTAASAIQLRDIRIMINGTMIGTGTTFSTVDRVIPAANTTTILTPQNPNATMIIERDAIAATDTVQITFADLKVAP